MKKMQCCDCGGPPDCQEVFTGETADEIAEQSSAHGMDMASKKDTAHMKAMEEMGEMMMSDENAFNDFMDTFQQKFAEAEEV